MFRYIKFALLSTSLLCLDAYAGGEKASDPTSSSQSSIPIASEKDLDLV